MSNSVHHNDDLHTKSSLHFMFDFFFLLIRRRRIYAAWTRIISRPQLVYNSGAFFVCYSPTRNTNATVVIIMMTIGHCTVVCTSWIAETASHSTCDLLTLILFKDMIMIDSIDHFIMLLSWENVQARAHRRPTQVGREFLESRAVFEICMPYFNIYSILIYCWWFASHSIRMFNEALPPRKIAEE